MCIAFSQTSLALLILNEQITNADTVANMMVKPPQARTLDKVIPSTLPVWDHKNNFNCMEGKKTVADRMVEPLRARKFDNVIPSTLPVWNHKDNFKFV